MKVRRLLLDEHAERLKRNKCPRCNNASLQEVDVSSATCLPQTRYKFEKTYWICGGHMGHDCYFLSSISGNTLFESAEGAPPIDFIEEPPQAAKTARSTVVRRRGGVVTPVA
jgi:hypothetical protein